MADTQIDELRLDVTIEDKTSGESSRKKVGDLAAAISRLNRAVDKFDAAKLSNVFNSITASIKPLSRELKGLGNKLDSIAIIAQKGGIKNITKSLSPILATEEVQSGNDGGNKVSAESGGSQAYNELTQSAKELNVEMKNLSENVEKSNKAHNKLLKSFGRIALYRAIRTVLKQITQAFMGSIKAISEYDEEFGKTFSTLQSSLTKLKFSIGIAFYQILMAFAPTIDNIVNSIADFANSISKVSARLRGQNDYLRINLEYLEQIQETQGQLLSFDTFETLGGSSNDIDYEKLFEKGNDALDDSKLTEREKILLDVSESLKGVLNSVFDILKTLWNDIIKPIMNSGIVSFILNIVASIVKFLDKAGLLKTVLISIAAIWTVSKISGIIGALGNLKNSFIGLISKIQTYNLQCALAKTKTQILQQSWKSLAIAGASVGLAVFSIIKNWDDMSSNTRDWVIAIASVTAGLAALAFTVCAILGQWAKAFTIAAGVITTGATVLTAVSAFANGGMMDDKKFSGTGTMYALAGESGAEVVATGSNGTGVLNVDQFADAMVSALVRYGAARDNGSGTAIEIDGNRLGTLIASSAGFRNEANRRNAGLNWK